MPTKNLEQFRRIIADKNLIETSRYKKNQSQKAKKEKNFVYNNTKTMALINNEEKCILEPGEFMVSVGGWEKDYKIWFIQIIYRKLSTLIKNEKNCN